MESRKDLHTVTLDAEKCRGCINCMKRCPTEAIRVRDGKAKVLYEKCIGCGECIRVCSNRAKRAVYDNFNLINGFKYKVVLPAPSLYGQFNNLTDINYVLDGLLRIGFDKVFEVSRSAEIVSELTRRHIDNKAFKKPVLSSACPAVVELVLLRFHDLTKNLLPMLAPVDIAAKIAKKEAMLETGLKEEEIGVFFISPCPAKVFAIKGSLGTKKPYIDGVFAQSDIYFRLVAAMNQIDKPREIAKSGIVGIGWAGSGGESAGILKEKYLAADGVENCISVLKELEDGKLKDLDFIELNACPGGCVGGVLNIENPFIARAKILSLRKYLPVTRNKTSDHSYSDDFYMWERVPENISVLKFDEDRAVAMHKMLKVEELLKTLPLLDCGVCGAPSCRAFAEDVINGVISEDNCTRRKNSDIFEEKE